MRLESLSSRCLARWAIYLAAAIQAATAAGTARAELKTVRDSQVIVEYYADGRGPLLVLLPSMARSADDFAEIVPSLVARGFRVIRPQPRGIGNSAGPDRAVTLHDLADDVALVIRRERRGRAILVGHAYGNFIARMVATDHPAIVRGVVVAAAAARPIPPDLLEAVTRMSEPSTSRSERLELLELAMFAPGNNPLPWLEGWHPKAREIARSAIAATPTSAWWSGGRAPILEIQGGSDPFMPPQRRGDLATELGPDRVTTVVVPGASHALFPEAPEVVAEVISHWERKLSRPRRR